ncbi:MAG: DUF4186 domain-containing protein [Bacillota bacterium]
MRDVNLILTNLSKSNFRSKFHLRKADLEYIYKQGLPTIKDHAYDFIINRLSINNKFIDGKQTPTKGHPVFIAQHATATCCRKCLKQWHGIEDNKILDEEEISYIVSVIMLWIDHQIKKY